MERIGTVLSVSGGLYEIITEEGERILCPARGVFRHDREKPTVGDRVCVTSGEKETEGTALSSILPRKNLLVRPPLANVSLLLVVFAALKPLPDLYTVDKLLAIAESLGITPVIVISKSDLSPSESERLAHIYRLAGYSVFPVSSCGDAVFGIEEIRDHLLTSLRGGIAAVAGASGVGKSTLLEALFPSLRLETGELSRKTARGKQTTRLTRLFPLRELCGEGQDGFVADTPGFSMLDFAENSGISKDNLILSFREFVPYLGRCRWADCRHHKEDGCAILEAIGNGKIAPSRYENYGRLSEELKPVYKKKG